MSVVADRCAACLALCVCESLTRCCGRGWMGAHAGRKGAGATEAASRGWALWRPAGRGGRGDQLAEVYR
eukprot:1189780-Prorocentrum_minimum.AAC.2